MNYISAGHCRHQHSAGICSKGDRDSVLCWRIRQDPSRPPPLLAVCHLGGEHEVVGGLPVRSDKCLRILTNFPDHWPQVSLTVSILRILNRKKQLRSYLKTMSDKTTVRLCVAASFFQLFPILFENIQVLRDDFYHVNRLGQAKTQLSKTS